VVRRRGAHDADLAAQAAGDAMLALLAKLHTYRGESRFTTWAYKFALYEAGVKLRRRAWQGREIPLEPDEEAEQRELVHALQDAIATTLTQHQREVLVALALNGVPIDVLAERLGTTRGALYKTLHDARRKLRAHLEHQGLDFDTMQEAR
jgi:RNA polymerase sigma-70 factor (ECF subfamily)